MGSMRQGRSGWGALIALAAAACGSGAHAFTPGGAPGGILGSVSTHVPDAVDAGAAPGSGDGGAQGGDFGASTLGGAGAFPVTVSFAASRAADPAEGLPAGVAISLLDATGTYPDSCGLVTAVGLVQQNALAIILEGSDSPGPGDYPVSTSQSSGQAAFILLIKGGVGSTDFEVGASGTVTVTQVGSTYAGSFTTTLVQPGNGSQSTGTLTGSFEAPFCP